MLDNNVSVTKIDSNMNRTGSRDSVQADDNQKLNETKTFSSVVNEINSIEKNSSLDIMSQDQDTKPKTEPDIDNEPDDIIKSSDISNPEEERQDSSLMEGSMTESMRIAADFEVFDMETSLPTVDWEALEQQLREAAKEQVGRLALCQIFVLNSWSKEGNWDMIIYGYFVKC